MRLHFIGMGFIWLHCLSQSGFLLLVMGALFMFILWGGIVGFGFCIVVRGAG
jgi:hypothetical protein